MKELVIISGKGGAGKTSVTAAFAALARKSVLVDCDVDAADMHLLMRPDIHRRMPFCGGKEAIIRAEDCTGCGVCLEHCRFGAVRLESGADARHIRQHLNDEGHANEQIAYADALVINKTDLVATGELTTLAGQLKLMNSEARQYPVVDAKVPVPEILALGGFDLRRIEHGVSGCSSQAFCATAQPKHHEHQIESISVAMEGEMDAEFFQLWIEGFIQLHAENLFRSKGILAVRGCPERLIFQGVHGMFRLTTGEPWNSETRQTRAIFIGRGLNRDEIIKGMQSCKAHQ